MSHTQLIPDIFEVEQSVQYSGSYNDGIYVGKILGGTLTPDPGFISAIIDGSRKRVAHHTTGSNLLFMVSQSYDEFNNAFLGTTIPYSLYAAHANRRIFGNSYRFNTSINSSEIYYDSLPPNPLAIYKLNGGKLVLSNLENWEHFNNPGSGSATDIAGEDAFLFFYKTGKFVLGYGDCRATSSTDNSTQISDNTWLSTFPYERRYANIQRMTDKLFINDPLIYGEAMSMSAGAAVGVKYLNSNPITSFGPSLSANRITIEFLSLSSSGDTLTNKRFHNTALEIRGFVRSGLTFVTYSVDVLNFTDQLNEQGININDQIGDPFLKTFFGTGDGFRGTPTFDLMLNTHSGSSFYFRSASPVIRGCRYGMFNTFPVKNRVVFRNNRYGHFRDMLEQRPFTKFYDPIGINSDGSIGKAAGASLAPVSITFVSGSDSYTTSSNPSLDTRETGFYNFEAAVGRPFFDA